MVLASTLWETAKAYLRGAIISYTTAKKKEALKQQIELEQQISEPERDFKQSSSKSVLLKLDAAHSVLDHLFNSESRSYYFLCQASSLRVRQLTR